MNRAATDMARMNILCSVACWFISFLCTPITSVIASPDEIGTKQSHAL